VKRCQSSYSIKGNPNCETFTLVLRESREYCNRCTCDCFLVGSLAGAAHLSQHSAGVQNYVHVETEISGGAQGYKHGRLYFVFVRNLCI
jgi:hypothetical protein